MLASQNSVTPILYSFRRCPYAMRARMAIHYAGIAVILREVELRDKPSELLLASPKATVPVLIQTDGRVIDESLDIIQWALSFSDPHGWLSGLDTQQIALADILLNENDGEFKQYLDQYKYADRFPEQSVEVIRGKAMLFLEKLEARLQKVTYLLGDNISFVDIAIFPFVRQFAFVDKAWFDESALMKLQNWLQAFLKSDYFTAVMKKNAAWQSGDDVVYL